MKRIMRLSYLVLLLVPAIVFAFPSSFVVKNSSIYPLGQVTLHYPGGCTTVQILTPGNYATDVPSGVTGITINGQRADAPNTRDIILSNDETVRVIWKSSSLVEIIDIATLGLDEYHR